ncbi:class I SAM-dependent methyltransferase [Cohnella sp. 56]|uniref:class I SAM-dependent methyltransferase n=1 Tax=Cohnella sp. 56 TaxID=3113722 RepID=UPI0030EB097F
MEEKFYHRITKKLEELDSHVNSNSPLSKFDLKDLEYNVKQNNLLWDIPTNENISSHRAKIGHLIVFGKKVVRKVLFWLVTKPLIQQREFNGSVTRSLNATLNLVALINNKEAEISTIQNHIEELKTQNKELLNEVNKLQNMIQDYKEKDKEKESFPINYKKFEDRFRGPEESLVAGQLEAYLPFLANKNTIVDLGCGRGELVEALNNIGKYTIGIDLNKDLVIHGREKGLEIINDDMISWLREDKNEKHDAITCLHVIEHLYPHQIVELVNGAYDNLNENGILIIETPNPETLYNLAFGFTIDLTHKKLIHAYTMRFILEEAGFRDIVVKHLAPTDKSVALEKTEISRINDENVDKINTLLYGYMNYAIIGRK